ncbi:MAG: cytochrome P450 [Bradymonadaceae bacterium]
MAPFRLDGDSDDSGEVPPGLGPLETLRVHYEFVRDPAAMFRRLIREHGPICRMWLGPMEHVLVGEPEAIREILVDKPMSFHKSELMQLSRRLVGRGLVLNEDDSWRRQRKKVAPNLQPRHIQQYGKVMVQETRRLLDGWQTGGTREFHAAMSEITMRVVVRTLFDLDPETSTDEVSRILERAMSAFQQMLHPVQLFIPDAIPTPANVEFDRAVEHLDRKVYDLIERCRAKEKRGDDLLSRLVEATDDEGDGMTDRQLRDEIVTMFVAGHETTALSLTCAFYLIARHPDVQQRIHREIDDHLGARPPDVSDVGDLPYLDAAIREAMRLHPPIWVLGRKATEAVEIGGYRAPPGTQFFLPQCALHRDPRFYDDPDTFRPDRWLEDRGDVPEFAYFPFGDGPRVCIGNHFAEMETILVAATLFQNWRVDNHTDPPLDFQHSMTKRPTHPIELEVSRR